MQTATEVITKIVEESKQQKKDDVVVPKMEFGDVVRQGDVYLTRLEKRPKGFDNIRENPQVAEGVTQGSRHVVRMAEGIVIYNPPKDANALVGPVIESPKRFWLDHPEHHNFSMPAGTYQVTFQRDYKKERAEEIRRVQD